MKYSKLLLLACFTTAVACASPRPSPDESAGSTSDDTQRETEEQREGESLDFQFEQGSTTADAEPGGVLQALSKEISRSMNGLSSQDEPPYYLSFQVTEIESRSVSASFGAINNTDDSERRIVDVDVRVGSYELDNTHELRGEWFGDYGRSRSTAFPFDDGVALRKILWRATDYYYKQAIERFIKVKANYGVKAPEEDRSADFTKGPKLDHVESHSPRAADLEAWKKNAERLSDVFSDYDVLESGSVSYRERVRTRYQVTSEGATVRKVRHVAHVSWYAQTTADDGMKIRLYDAADAFDPEKLPSYEQLKPQVEAMAEKVVELRKAPKAEPYVGPAILEGEAAGVFFHEALGHRVEGHRQVDEDEGQTFAKKIGEQVLPTFLDVYDDPRLKRTGDVPLMGHYRVDDQAVPAQRADIIDDGTLVGFLMSRTPVRKFKESNGHGRRQAGKHVVARQGNLVVHPDRGVSRDRLKEKLIEEIEEQDKPYGLRFVRVQGGFTLTGRRFPQSFKVLPLVVYRVYPDGREELIRGVTLEGTPLTVLSEIKAASNDIQVFNGMCGAESGHVPVSSVSPSLLVERIEAARAPKASDRPPILSPPPKEPKKDEK